MKLKNLITSNGSILSNNLINKSIYVLKTDPMNHRLWRKKKSSLKTQHISLEKFKQQFIKN